MGKSVSFSAEEAAVLYRYVTGSSFAPSPEAVEAGAVPSDHQDAVDRLAEAARSVLAAEAQEAREQDPASSQAKAPADPPAGTRTTAGSAPQREKDSK